MTLKIDSNVKFKCQNWNPFDEKNLTFELTFESVKIGTVTLEKCFAKFFVNCLLLSEL